MARSKKVLTEDISDKKIRDSSEDYIEDVERSDSTKKEVTDLSGIEATAASKAAWLISITVSLGGFLFG